MDQPLALGVLVSTLTIGGAEQILSQLLGRLDRARFSPRLYCLRDPGAIGREIEASGVPVRAGLVPKHSPLAPLALARVFSKDRLDALLFINHRDCMVYGTLAAGIAGVPTVVNWEHETFKRHRFHGLFMVLRQGLLWGMKAVVGAALGHARYLVDVERTPIRKTLAIPNGVDPKSLRPRLDPKTARERLGLREQDKVVGIFAALRPDKAHEIFLRAAALTLERVPDARFLVVGDGERRAFLEKLAAELNLGQAVRFLGFRRDAPDILAAMDLGALSSKPEQETLSMAAMEAMAAGIPMVCPDVGFLSEIVIPGRTGLLVPPRDPEALGLAMAELLSDDARRGQMGREAAAFIAARNSLALLTSRFETLFTELAAGRPPRPALCPLKRRSVVIGVTWREGGEWELIQRLREGLERADVVCLSRRTEALLSRLPAGRRPAAMLALAWALFRRRWRYDAVASWSITPAVALGLMLRVLPPRMRPLHICRDFHLDPDRTGPAYRLRLFILRLAMPGMDAVWCTSEAERSRYAEMFGMDVERFAFYPDEPPSAFLREPWTEPGRYVFSYGNSDRDFGCLLEAAKGIDRELVILSQARDFPEEAAKSARVIRERVSERELIDLIKGAAVVVAPTVSRNLAAGQNVMLEAMALGRPVVAAANTATLEYAVHGETALFYEPGNAGELAARLGELLDDPERAAAMGRRGREAARELHQSQPERFLRLFEKALSAAGK